MGGHAAHKNHMSNMGTLVYDSRDRMLRVEQYSMYQDYGRGD